MKKAFALMLSAIFMLSAASLFAADYNGAKKCTMCHKRKHPEHIEKMTAHAHFTKAWDVLKPEQQKDPKCVVCHTTGFGNGGYEIKDDAFWANKTDKAVKDMMELQFVGCEACHTDLTNADNFKAHSKKDATYKPVKPTEETCKTCHNEKSPTFKPINFSEEIKKLK